MKHNSEKPYECTFTMYLELHYEYNGKKKEKENYRFFFFKKWY